MGSNGISVQVDCPGAAIRGLGCQLSMPRDELRATVKSAPLMLGCERRCYEALAAIWEPLVDDARRERNDHCLAIRDAAPKSVRRNGDRPLLPLRLPPNRMASCATRTGFRALSPSHSSVQAQGDGSPHCDDATIYQTGMQGCGIGGDYSLQLARTAAKLWHKIADYNHRSVRKRANGIDWQMRSK